MRPPSPRRSASASTSPAHASAQERRRAHGLPDGRPDPERAGEPTGAVVVTRDIGETQRAEALQRESEAKYRSLTEHLPTITYVHPLGERGTPLYVSPQVAAILGYSAEEWLRQAEPVLPAGAPGRPRARLRRDRCCAAGARPLQCEYRMLVARRPDRLGARRGRDRARRRRPARSTCRATCSTSASADAPARSGSGSSPPSVQPPPRRWTGSASSTSSPARAKSSAPRSNYQADPAARRRAGRPRPGRLVHGRPARRRGHRAPGSPPPTRGRACRPGPPPAPCPSRRSSRWPSRGKPDALRVAHVRAAARPRPYARRAHADDARARPLLRRRRPRRRSGSRRDGGARDRQRAPARARWRSRADAARVLTYVADGVVLVDQTGVIRIWNPAAEAITGLDVRRGARPQRRRRDRRLEGRSPSASRSGRRRSPSSPRPSRSRPSTASAGSPSPASTSSAASSTRSATSRMRAGSRS